MNVHEILQAFAEELENSENVALRNAEESDETLEIVATACLQAAEIFREAAKKTAPPCKPCKGKGKVDGKECKKCKGKGKLLAKKADDESTEESVITPERLEEIAALAEEFDRSGDELLQKQASVLDEILLTIAAPKGVKSAAVSAEEKKIEDLKKEYAKTKEVLDENIKVSDARKDLEKSEYYKEYRPLEAALNTRYCPDHPGVMVSRVGEHEYQCSLDKKTYNWESGYRTAKGNVVPGGRVEDQTRESHVEPHAIFDTREGRLGSNYEK